MSKKTDSARAWEAMDRYAGDKGMCETFAGCEWPFALFGDSMEAKLAELYRRAFTEGLKSGRQSRARKGRSSR